MPEFFPEPYNDELLHSVISRYHVRSGNIFFRTTMMELFGNPDYSAVVDLPCHIDNLVNSIPYPLKKEELISSHTLFPFYTVFLPIARSKSIYDAISGPYKGNIRLKTGIAGNSIQTSPFLKFCPECCREDLEKHGEYYWHRLHNTPGVLVCPIHKTVLRDSFVKSRANYRKGFPAANPENCPDSALAESFDKDTIEKLAELACNIQWLYRNYSAIKQSPDFEQGFRHKYLALLTDKGLITNANKQNFMIGFLRDFQSYHGEKLLGALQSDFSVDYRYSWTRKIIRKHEKSFHPIRHLLMMRFLCGSVERFIATPFRPDNEEIRKASQRSKSFDATVLEKQRNKWIALKNKYPGLTRSALALKSHKLFVWLYKNDKAWIDIISPCASPVRKIDKIDWKERDRTALDRVRAYVQKTLGSSAKPERLTINSIARKFGALDWLKKHSGKMPDTAAFLREHVETIEEFQIRRIAWIAEKLHSEGRILREWEIIRLAGLRPEYSPRVAESIEEVLGKYPDLSGVLMKTG